MKTQKFMVTVSVPENRSYWALNSDDLLRKLRGECGGHDISICAFDCEEVGEHYPLPDWVKAGNVCWYPVNKTYYLITGTGTEYFSATALDDEVGYYYASFSIEQVLEARQDDKGEFEHRNGAGEWVK